MRRRVMLQGVIVVGLAGCDDDKPSPAAAAPPAPPGSASPSLAPVSSSPALAADRPVDQGFAGCTA
jgi:hypothetical protein